MVFSSSEKSHTPSEKIRSSGQRIQTIKCGIETAFILDINYGILFQMNLKLPYRLGILKQK